MQNQCYSYYLSESALINQSSIARRLFNIYKKYIYAVQGRGGGIQSNTWKVDNKFTFAGLIFFNSKFLCMFSSINATLWIDSSYRQDNSVQASKYLDGKGRVQDNG